MSDTFLHRLRKNSLYRSQRRLFDILLGITLLAVLVSGGVQIFSAFQHGKTLRDGVDAVASNFVAFFLVLLLRYFVCVMFDLVDVSALKIRDADKSPDVDAAS